MRNQETGLITKCMYKLPAFDSCKDCDGKRRCDRYIPWEFTPTGKEFGYIPERTMQTTSSQ